ncbi:lipid asymmetry maintenance protein MlaB [Biostraticola tofi]|uniref:Phospholipid transport system transporter-binding protein n=1 Tax=Biostraticola tofi TaxID=466109 RepID=A0A4R3Z1A8_9GAMM|nr:lipid asymmetry maintenance protein MlaB [Biostraticola tofi]TCV98775.1 phospholipid transport system transporter-binding protein [Biostraticola tofi]
MADALSWQVSDSTLILQGELDRVTLLDLWDQRSVVLSGIRYLDVSRLERVDSAGVAMILHLCEMQVRNGHGLSLMGVTDRLKTLITLYNLHDILPTDTPLAS